jgi:hypothetical protein
MALTWKPSPVQLITQASLTGIAAVSNIDVWAVGSVIVHGATPGSMGTAPIDSMVQHWDGSIWNLSKLPPTSPVVAQGPNFERLNGVCAISSKDVWAVGASLTPGPTSNKDNLRPLVAHWDGTQWLSITPAFPSMGANELFAVHGRHSNDVWAVGSYGLRGQPKSGLILRYDGISWHKIAAPHVGTGDNILYGVATLSNDDAWAVGAVAGIQDLILHWDGGHWTVVPRQAIASYPTLKAIIAVARNDIWAVGNATNGGISCPLALHWDGTSWTEFRTDAGITRGSLVGASAISSDEVVAVGAADGPNGTDVALIQLWNGRSWSALPVPLAPSTYGSPVSQYVNSVSMLPSGEGWAAGYLQDVPGFSEPMVQRCYPREL